jgi:hypothetical protein
MLLNEFQYFPSDRWIIADITILDLPIAYLADICILGWDDTDSDLGRLTQIRTVERDCGEWPTPHSLSRFLLQALDEPAVRHGIAPWPPLR